MEDDIVMATDDQEEQENTEQKVINEEYKIWKKNAPFLYDLMLSTALEWPTLTTQWFPDKQSNPENSFSTHRLLIGTHTSSDSPNYLQIANVQLPNPTDPDPKNYDEDKEEIGGHGAAANGSNPNASAEVKFNIVQKIDHPGEVNKARYMPQNPDMIATMCVDGHVLIWDRTKHSINPDGKSNPQMTLIGHTKEGYGLSWSPHNAGHLVTGSEDKTVRLWDTTKYSKQSKDLKAVATYTHHSAIVSDVQYHPSHKFIIGSVSDDLTLQILDIRDSNHTQSRLKTQAHTDAVNALAFNPANDVTIVTASADHSIGVWDLRNLAVKLHSLDGHRDAVNSLSWHPTEESILASSSQDRRLIFWDLSRIGDEQSQEDLEDGPPELLFMHGGHTNTISDFSWNQNDPWVVCSAAEDNLLQVWKVANAIVGKDPDDVPTEELDG